MGLNRADKPARQLFRVKCVGRRMDYGEFVAAKSGNGSLIANGNAKALGKLLQEFVANWVAKRVVHRLEIIEVEAHDGHRLFLLGDASESFDHLLAEQQAIWQVRQGVMSRDVADVFFCPVAFRYVFIGAHPAAASHRLMAYGDHSPIGEMAAQFRFLVVDQPLLEIDQHFLGADARQVNAVGDDCGA